jgi:hypothetical protein
MNLPLLPPKVGSRMMTAEEDKDKLNVFLKELISYPELLNNKLVRDFLNVHFI